MKWGTGALKELAFARQLSDMGRPWLAVGLAALLTGAIATLPDDRVGAGEANSTAAPSDPWLLSTVRRSLAAASLWSLRLRAQAGAGFSREERVNYAFGPCDGAGPVRRPRAGHARVSCARSTKHIPVPGPKRGALCPSRVLERLDRRSSSERVLARVRPAPPDTPRAPVPVLLARASPGLRASALRRGGHAVALRGRGAACQ